MARNYGGFRRARPKVSFAMATGMVFTLAAAMSGLLHVNLDASVFDANPRAVGVALALACLAGLLLHEW